MRPRPRKAWSLKNGQRAAVVAMLAALAVIFVTAGSAKPPPPPAGNYQVCLAAFGTACTPTTGGGTYSILTGANPEVTLTITNDGSSTQTLDYANIGVPTDGSGITIDTAHSPQTANYTTYASTSTSSTLQLRNLALAPGNSQTISFFVNSAHATCTDGTWTTLAQSSSTPSAFVFSNPPIKSSGLTSLVAKSCALAFSPQPTSALKGAIVTSQAYTAVDNVNTFNVAVTPVGLQVPLNGGTVTFTPAGDFDPGNAGELQGLDAAPFSSGSVVLSGLKSTATGGPFTITASADGFDTSAVSDPFFITQYGEHCSGQCSTLNGNDTKGNVLFSVVTSGGFSFVGGSPSGVPLDPDNPIPNTDPQQFGFPLGCQSWSPLGNSVSGFVEFDGRTTGGTLQISYYVSQSAIKAKYGKNTGQQFIPICFGAKYLDANQQPLDCRTHPHDGGGWMGDELTGGTFDGKPFQSICGAGGYYWGILSSYQDKLDQGANPVVTGFNGPTNIGQNFRTFVITVPPGIDARGSG
jgi:hypothetical protein